MDKEELAYLGVRKLKMRFTTKIEPSEYYLSYSSGRDSHLLYWFIKHYLLSNQIKIVSVNTYREHCEVRERMYRNADIVLYPTMSMNDIKEKYGIPCFTKMQDEIIKRYQRGSRAPYTMGIINGTNTTIFKLNKKAKDMLLNDNLHKISSECCKYTEKKPLQEFEKETGLKPIIGVRGSESRTRKRAYSTCLDSKGKFSPLYDFSDDMVNAIYEVYGIDELAIYDHLDATGCIGCPYGYHGKKMTIKELEMVTPQQLKYAIDSFSESYKVLGILESIQQISRG